MNSNSIKKLTEAAKADPKLFHALVFNPESVLSKLDYLDQEAKGRLIAINPESFIGALIGDELSDCTVTVNCGSTCTHTVSKKDLASELVNPAILKRR